MDGAKLFASEDKRKLLRAKKPCKQYLSLCPILISSSVHILYIKGSLKHKWPENIHQ